MATLQELYEQLNSATEEILPEVAARMGGAVVEPDAPAPSAGEQLAATPPPAPAAEAEEENVGQSYADMRLKAATSALRNQRDARKQLI